MRYNGVIFDLDGVICHTDKYHYQAWKLLADELGIYFDEKINNRLRGVSRMECLEIILEKYQRTLSDSEKLELATKKNDVYKNLLKDLSAKDLSPEVKDTLIKLKDKGLKLAIGSSSKNTMLILGQLGLKDFFHAISDGNNITKSKPDPEVFTKAASFINLAPKECLVIEDAIAGIEAAFRGGFDSAGIGEAAEHKNVTYKITSLRDLLKIVF